MNTPTDAERDELENRVSDVLYEVAEFAWTDLAERVPIGRTYVRPENEGPYMAVNWDADWKRQEGGPILIVVTGYLDKEHKHPVWGSAEVIRKRGLIARPFRRE
jgi:hypothetical protein